MCRCAKTWKHSSACVYFRYIKSGLQSKKIKAKQQKSLIKTRKPVSVLLLLTNPIFVLLTEGRFMFHSFTFLGAHSVEIARWEASGESSMKARSPPGVLGRTRGILQGDWFFLSFSWKCNNEWICFSVRIYIYIYMCQCVWMYLCITRHDTDVWHTYGSVKRSCGLRKL